MKRMRFVASAICALTLGACDDVPDSWAVKTEADAIAAANAGCIKSDDKVSHAWTVYRRGDVWQVWHWDIIDGNRRADVRGSDGSIVQCR